MNHTAYICMQVKWQFTHTRTQIPYGLLTELHLSRYEIYIAFLLYLIANSEKRIIPSCMFYQRTGVKNKMRDMRRNYGTFYRFVN